LDSLQKRGVSFGESKAAECRWSQYAEELFSDWEIIWDESEANYQGTVRFLARKDGKFAYLNYSYGSCSGCDSWEDMPEDKVRADMKNLAEYFESAAELKKFADQVNYGASFDRIVDEVAFYVCVDKELERE
jgi:hypothetical protein